MDYFLSRLLTLVSVRDQSDTGRAKHSLSGCALLLASTVGLAGCELIGDIFQAGVWVGVILVVLVIGLVVWLFTRSRA